MRIFAPLALVSIAAHFGWIETGSTFEWLGSTSAMLCFSFACVVEVLGMLIPWLDHALDVAGAPVAAVAGTIMMASQLAAQGGIDTSVVPQWVTWTLAAVVGGGVATGVHAANGTIRVGSTAVSGGILNPLFSIVETVMSVVLAGLALLLPIVAVLFGVLVASVIVGVALMVNKRSKRRRESTAIARPA